MRFLDARHAPTVAALFDGSLDAASCVVCAMPIGITPTMIMIFDQPPGIRVLVGSLMIDTAEFAEFLIKAFGFMAINMFAETRTPDEFRASVLDRLQPQLQAVSEIATRTDSDGVAQYVEERWRDLTASTFSVALAATMDPERWSVFGHLMRAGVAAIAEAQACVWKHVALLQRDHPEADSLDADLHAFVADSSVVPGAPTRLLEQLPPIDDFVSDYVANAVIATAFHAANEPNPRAARWAKRYVELSRWLTTDPEGAALRSMYELPMERILATIPEANLTVALREAGGVDERLARRIAGHAGRPEVADRLAYQSPSDTRHQVPESKPPTFSDAAPGDVDTVLNDLRIISEELVRTTDSRRAKEVTDLALTRIGDDATARARIVAWLARCLIDMGRPHAAVKALGEASGPWEKDADDLTHQALMLLRATASMWAMPNHVASLVASAWTRQAEGVGTSPELVQQFNRHAAEQAMRTGGPDMAVQVLGPQARRTLAAPGGDTRLVLDFARALGACGRYGESLHAVKQALSMDSANALHGRITDAFRARLLAALGSYREAATILFHWPVETIATEAVIDLAAATTIIRRADPSWLRPGLKAYLWSELESALHAAVDAEEWYTAMRCLGAMGSLGEACGLDDVMESYWRLMLRIAATHGYPPDAEALAWLAARAFRRGDLNLGRWYLVQIPMGLKDRLGAVRDVSAIPNVADPLKVPLAAAMDALFAYAPPPVPLIRSVAEMQRDIITRAQVSGGARLTDDHEKKLTAFNVLTDALPKVAYESLVEQAAHTILDSTMNDEFLRALAPPVGSVAVVEWVSHSASVAVVLTTVRADDTIDGALLRPPEVDLPATARKVASRLAGWWPERDGDPLDWAPWRSIERWLVEQLGSAFGDQRGHVVFIDPPWGGLPWHLVCAGRWTSSYVSGWTVLLEILRRAPAAAPRSVGMLAAPAVDEYPEVTAAFDASQARHRTFGSAAGLRLHEYIGGLADATAFRRVMTDADVVKILCHGLVLPASSEIALMLASEEHLPPVHALAADGPNSERYRMSWRDCQRLPKSADTVYSAACGTGRWHPAAWGDRSSLFRALRLRGTRTFVAPRWDAIAPVVIPIIDEVIELTVGKGMLVADAVETASAVASRHHPLWIARSLAIEGDWR